MTLMAIFLSFALKAASLMESPAYFKIKADKLSYCLLAVSFFDCLMGGTMSYLG